MNVILGQHAAAFDNITYLLYNRIEGSTFYREGVDGSCTETPYAAAWAVTDWCLQSWNTTAAGQQIIDFYPGIDDVIHLNGSAYEAAPAKAASIAFWRLAAEGGLLASASRETVVRNASHYITRTTFVAVEVGPNGTPDGTVVVRTKLARPLSIEPAFTPFKELGDGDLVAISLGAGESAVLYSALLP